MNRLTIGATLIFGAIASNPALSASHPGDLDPNFGPPGAGNGQGYVTYDFENGDDVVYALAPMRDGRFYAAGAIHTANQASPGSSSNVGIARFLSDGRLDATFGNGAGWQVFDFDAASGPDEIRAMRVMSDGRIVLAGTTSISSHLDFFVMRVMPDGSLDTSFGKPAGVGRQGWNSFNVAGTLVFANNGIMADEASALAVQADGKLIVAGITHVPEPFPNGSAYVRGAVARFTADGAVDTTFGTSGAVILPSLNTDHQSADYVTGTALRQDDSPPSDNSITIFGQTFGRSNSFVVRLTANGTFDTTFGAVSGSIRTGVYTSTSFTTGGVTTGVNEIYGARYTSGGKLVIAGTGADRGITLMQLTSNGTLDTNFAANGRVNFKLSGTASVDAPWAVALQGNGKIVASGYTSNVATGDKDIFVVRALPDGRIDPGFGDGSGRKMVSVSTKADEATALAVEPSGNLLVGGYQQRSTSATQQFDFVLLRLLGDPDRIFFYDFDPEID
jgi:uncharacterized delta-60 repeat protein